ncbi:MAG: GT2 family glycosyltransferase [Polaribacter sp.]|jgi:GT2 family glycosyltransferase
MIKKTHSYVKQWLHYSINTELLPLSCIQNSDAGSWLWFGGDPQIELLVTNNVLLKGYYMLEVEIADLNYTVNSILYSDQGIGFNEDDAFQLPIIRVMPGSRTVKRICLFNSPVKSLRFDPSEEDGGCSKLSIKLIKLTQYKARQLMLKKFATTRPEYNPSENLLDLYHEYNGFFNKLSLNDYGSWIVKHEYNLKLSEAEVANKIASLTVNPLISIVCPVYNTNPEWLVACVESVHNQHYTNWELILVDDASPNQDHFDVLKRYTDSDSRIQTVFLDLNSHISAATNAGIRQANGEYALFLDHDDELAENALLEVCDVINAHPNAKIIYSDEDLMSEEGDRIAPHFKSDWNAELLRAHNYVTHLCCYEMSLLTSLGGMRLGYEGAQDYDLILRASAAINAEDIYHIPKILYHWRMVEGSTALSPGAKSYATEAGLKALQDYVAVNNITATAQHAERENFYTLQYSIPCSSADDSANQLPKVSIIIPTRDGIEVLKPCIDTLLEKTTYQNYDIVILDNGSVKQETLSYLHQLSQHFNIQVVRDNGEFNYSRINNLAVSHSTGELICLLNNDIEIIDDNWLTEMVSVAYRKEVGCVGAKLLYPDGTIQHAGVIFGLGGYAAHSHRGLNGHSPGYFCRAQLRQQLSAVTGACLVVRRGLWEQVAGLDEAFQVAYNDVDFCLRIQALGYQNIYTPFATLIHHESKTRGEDVGVEKAKRFDQEKALLLARWSAVIANDPFYNINLTRAREDFSI